MLALLSYPSVELKNQRLDMIIFDSASIKHYHMNFDTHFRCRFLGYNQACPIVLLPVFSLSEARNSTLI